MNETLQNFSNIAVAVGILLTALGGYGSYIFGKRFEKEKEAGAKATELQLSLRIEQLSLSAQALENRLGPFEKLAAALYPNMQLESAMEKLRQDTLDLRKKTEAMEVRATPRTISPESAVKFIKSLRNVPKGKVEIHSYMTADPETIQYANQIRDMVEAAGFNTEGMVTLGILTGSIPVGVGLTIRDPGAAPLFAGPVQCAFDRIGVHLDGFVDPSLPADKVRVLIGLKPK